MILIVDFGAQYSQLIARRVREANVYCEIVPYTYTIEQIRRKAPMGIILSGGPASVYVENAPKIDKEIFNLGVPVLGICYGGQFIAQEFGGKVRRADFREYGRVKLKILTDDKLFRNIDQNTLCWMSHTDFIEIAPEGFEITASSESCPVCAVRNEEKKIYAVQFHPEVEHTEKGREIINNFLFNVCEINKDDIKSIYNEADIYFSNNVNKTLDELEDFYEKLITNRKKRLLEQKTRLSAEIQAKSNKSKLLQDEFDELMQYLGEHQALDVFVSLSNKSASLKSERDSLKKYQDLQSEYKEKGRQAEKDLLNLAETTEKYLKEIESDVVELRDFFRGLAKKFYPNSVAGLAIENNDGDNQLQFNIDAKIESDTSDGINNVKIFCYDLTILFKGHNHRVNFVFHDSRLFDGIDERQKVDIFKIVCAKFTNKNKQYIATVNQNQLNEVRRLISKEEFDNIITKNTVLTLTDESDSQKLLGIKVDIGDN